VRDQERQRVTFRGARVQEVDALAVDLGDRRRERVEARLLGAPVEPVLPVREQRLEVAALGAHLPADAVELVREAGIREAGVQVVEDVLRDVDRRGRELQCHALILVAAAGTSPVSR
jgi:hypothetical protein